MSTTLLVIHSLLRWALLALLVIGAIRAAVGWRRRRAITASDQKLGLVSMIVADTQLLIGLALYAGVSPLMQAIWAGGMGAAMKSRMLRFWAVEHISLMVLAIALIHLGRILARRAADDRQRHFRTMVTLLVALLLIAAAIPWPFISEIGRPLLPL
jgi:hypothetical protein